MYTTNDLLNATALEQARLIRTREVSCTELTNLYLERIEQANPVLYAFVEQCADDARLEARRKDRQPRPASYPPFHGVVTAIKDLHPLRGSHTRFGSKAFSKFYTPFDDRVIARLRQGGFVFVGKTATSEFGALPVTEPDLHPATRNPWDLQRTPGGSSGGAGAALAAGLVPIAQGSDGAGSIRIPCAFNHVFGMKPSRGRVPDPYGQPDEYLLYTVGPLTRSVEDAAAFLDVIAGLTVQQPHWAPPPPCLFLELARRPPPSQLRIRYTTKNLLTPTHPDITAAVMGVVKWFEQEGHHVEEGVLVEATVEEFLPLWRYTIGHMPLSDWSQTQPVSRWLGENGKHISEASHQALLTKLARRVLHWFEGADLWITPTVAVPPPLVGAWGGLSAADTFSEAAKLGAFTAIFNVSGQPAASVPAGFTSEGWPIGVQLAAKPFADGLLLSVCRQLEEAMPWRHHQAPFPATAGRSERVGPGTPR